MAEKTETKRIPLAEEIRIANSVAETLQAAGINEDDPDYKDLLGAETDIEERLVRMARAARRAYAMADAMDKVIEENKARKDKHLKKAENIEQAIFWAYQQLQREKPIVAYDVTIGTRKLPAKVVGGGDPKLLPAKFQRVKPEEIEADKKAILAALKAGEQVEGYTLSNGGESLKLAFD